MRHETMPLRPVIWAKAALLPMTGADPLAKALPLRAVWGGHRPLTPMCDPNGGPVRA